jgi:hypothetical protein
MRLLLQRQLRCIFSNTSRQHEQRRLRAFRASRLVWYSRAQRYGGRCHYAAASRSAGR